MNIYELLIFCGLVSSTLGNKHTEFETTLQSPWEVPLLVVGVVFGFAVVLFYMVRANTTQMADSASQRLSAKASSRVSAKGDYRSTNSAPVAYERPPTFTEKCCGVLCCRKPRDSHSLRSIPSMDIPDDQYELVVEKLMLYDVPLAVTAVAEDLYDHQESMATMRKETESILTPRPPSKRKSYSTLTSYFAMVPGPPPMKPDQEPTRSAQLEEEGGADVQSTTMTTSTYFDMVPRAVSSQQSAPVNDAGMKPVESEIYSYYSTASAGPSYAPDDTQSTSTYFDMVPKAMTSQQSMPSDDYGVSPSQPDVGSQGPGDDSINAPVQPVILPCTTSYTSAPMKGEPHSPATYVGGAPSLEQGKDYRTQTGPQYMCRHVNPPPQVIAEEKIPLSPEPARIMPQVQSASYYDMIPKPFLSTQSLEEGERIRFKPAQPVIQSYLATTEQQVPLEKYPHELRNVEDTRENSRPTSRPQPCPSEVVPFLSDSGSGPKQTMSPRESSLYYAMVPSPYRVTDKSTKPKREAQPVSTYFVRTYDSAPNVLSQSFRQHLVRNDMFQDTAELNDNVPTSVSSTDNKVPMYFVKETQPESKYRPTESSFVPPPAQPWQTARRNDDVERSTMGSNDTEVGLGEPQTPPPFVFGATDRKTVMHTTISNRLPFHRKPMTSSLQLSNQEAIPMSDYSPVVPTAQPWRVTQRNENVESISPGPRDTELENMEPESHPIFGGKDKITVMHATSSSNMQPSAHDEPPIVSMSSGHLVPTTDEERRQMNQYLNQFSSIFTYNLKDPIPKDPERLPGRSSNPTVHQRESRSALAESLSHMGATESSWVNWNQTPRATPSNKREQESDYQAQSSSKRPRTAERVKSTAEKTGGRGRNNTETIYTAQMHTDPQQQDRNNEKDFETKEDGEPSAPVKPLQIPYDRISSEVCCTNFEGVSSTGRPNMAPSRESGFTSKSACNKSHILNTLSRQESGLSKELGCAMLECGSIQQTSLHQSALSKEIGCANLDYYSSQPHTVPVQESGMSKEMGCATLDGSLSKPDNVPIKESGLSKEIGCANLDDYASTLAENTRSEMNVAPLTPGMSSEMRCISTGQMHPRKMLIANKSGKSKELGCQQLEDNASSHHETQSAEEKLCSPSASEKVEHLYEYDVDNTWEKKPTSVHSAHVPPHAGSITTMTSTASSPIPASSAMKHSETPTVMDREPCMHDSLKSIMSPTELGASSSVIDTRQLVPEKSSKKSVLNAKASTKVETLTVAYSGTVNPVSFTNATSPSAVDAIKDPSTTERYNDEVRKSVVSFKIPAAEADSQGSTWEDFDGARDLSIIDRPNSTSSQPPKGATLRWKIIIKHKPDDVESRNSLPMLKPAVTTEGSPAVDDANNESAVTKSRDHITDEEHTD